VYFGVAFDIFFSVASGVDLRRILVYFCAAFWCISASHLMYFSVASGVDLRRIRRNLC